MRNLLAVLLFVANTSFTTAQWTLLDTLANKQTLFAIKFVNSNTGYAVGASATIIKTLDSGKTWNFLKCKTGTNFWSIFCTDSNTVYIGGDSCIFKTNDGGNSWSKTSIGNNYSILSIFFIDSINGFAVGGNGDNGLILKTSNKGVNWSILKINYTNLIRAVYFVNKDTGFVAGDNGIYRTIDAGINWTCLNTNGFNSIYFTSQAVGYAAGRNGTIIKTVNCGNDWTSQKPGLNYNLNFIVFPNPNYGYAFGDAGVILSTINAGRKWSFYYGQGYSNNYAASFVDTLVGYAVGGGYGSSTIIKTINGGGPEYNYNPLKDFNYNVQYVTCGYAMANFSFNTDTVFPGDTACWDFGDGSHGCNGYSNAASHNYSSPGSYSVSLTFIRNGNSKTITKSNIVIIRNAPKVLFSYTSSDTLFFAPSTIHFNNQTLKGDGDSLKYLWNFGDNITSNDTNPVHTYINPGTYYINLNVNDNFGCSVGSSNYIIIKDTAQRNEFNFITSTCNNGTTSPCGSGQHFEITNDTLKMYGLYSGTCCTIKTATMKISGDTIYIRTYQSGPACTCDCLYCFSINVPNISEDSVIVSFDGVVHKAKLGTSINSNLINYSFEVYPNPTINEFTLSCDKLTNKSSIEIIDLFGRTIYNLSNSIYNNMIIHCNNINSGVYIIKLNIDKDNYMTKKMIINNAR
jgi:photosystem II stability/assembly factor-like uncharacterized protein